MASGPSSTATTTAASTGALPPTPPDCELAGGVGTVLEPDRAGQLLCAGDTVADAALPVVPYGEGVRYGPTVCVVRETGVRCDNSSNGHGFAVARAVFELF